MPLAERGVCWAGFGHYVPDRCVPNAEIEAAMELPPGWIVGRTGIERRHYAAPDQAVSDLAVPAAAMALRSAAAEAAEVGLLLLATSTPDHLLPPTAPLVAHRLGLGCGAVDLAGACAGFLYALVLGANHARATGQSVLVVAANLLSRRIDPQEAASRVLFADAAGAVLLRPCTNPARGLLAQDLGSDGGGYDLIRIDRGGSRLPFGPEGEGNVAMKMPDGRSVFTAAVQTMADSGRRVLAAAGMRADQVATWVPHQANGRIIDQVGHALRLEAATWLGTLARHGNSSAATIPLALSSHVASGQQLPPGPVLLSAFGAGTIWGSVLWRL